MNLLLVEDDVEYADILEAELKRLDHRVVVAGDGRAALVAVEGESFDAIILDRMMPEMDGATMVGRLRDRGQQLPVLMLSALGQTAEKIEGLGAGADDYVVKPASALEIDARLKALVRARGWTGGDSDTLRVGDVVVSPGQFRAWRNGEALNLTATEFKLLAELARHAGGFVTRAMLFESVWGYDFDPGTNIVEGHIKTLRRKLNENGGEDPIVTKRGVGYMLQG